MVTLSGGQEGRLVWMIPLPNTTTEEIPETEAGVHTRVEEGHDDDDDMSGAYERGLPIYPGSASSSSGTTPTTLELRLKTRSAGLVLGIWAFEVPRPEVRP